MGVNPEQVQQLKNGLTLLNAEIAMLEKELETFKALSEAEAGLTRWNELEAATFAQAKRAHTAAQADLKVLAIEKLKAERNICQAMLDEAQKSVKVPGKGRVQLS